MSKMSEQKALEAYPRAKEEPYSTGFINKETLSSSKREGYIVGYDQAMQDFLEKACEWFEDTQLENFNCRDDGIYFDNERFIEQYKNYMQNESEN